MLKPEAMLGYGLSGCRKRVQREGGRSTFIVISLFQPCQHGIFSLFGRLVAGDRHLCCRLG
ncbi:hypothetical protein D3C72_2444180 [compost metagenome]